MKALFFDEDDKLEQTIEDYDMGNEVGVWPEATENGYYLARRYISGDEQEFHFRKGFDGYP